MRVRFADCVFDSETRELLREGSSVHLSPKALQLLELLLSERPRAVAKSRIQDAIWPRTFVSEANVTNLIGELRFAVGDRTRPGRIIRTVQRFGYAFRAEAEPAPLRAAAARHTCRLMRDGEDLPLDSGESLVGRDPDSAVRVDDERVSRRHARIRVDGGRATVEDLGSKNGTYVRGIRIAGPTALENGDELRVGSASFTFRVAESAASTASAIED
jgi:DNA-binding winged helix-turn-helix (wHTH) protein